MKVGAPDVCEKTYDHETSDCIWGGGEGGHLEAVRRAHSIVTHVGHIGVATLVMVPPARVHDALAAG